MSGYTPLFESLTTGTLCGKWPDVGLWPIILSLADRHGDVDKTPTYIAGVTGLPVVEVAKCMQRFCEPDPDSRSSQENGARLVLVDPEHRDWGWRVVNHGKYREKARLASKNAAEVASGKNAERIRDRRGPPGTAADHPSDSDSDSDLNVRRKTVAAARPMPAAFHDEVIASYHELLPMLSPVKRWSKKRRQALNARIAERLQDGKPADTIGYWRDFFEKVAASDFLCGSGKFIADLEWLLRPENFLKTIEGRYDNRPAKRGANSSGERAYAS
jgi:hypothetical protein